MSDIEEAYVDIFPHDEWLENVIRDSAASVMFIWFVLKLEIQHSSQTGWPVVRVRALKQKVGLSQSPAARNVIHQGLAAKTQCAGELL